MADITEPQAIPPTLQAIRSRLDLTQEQLAERLGVSFATVNRWEGGVTKPQRAARTAITALAAEAGIEAVEPDLNEAESAAQVTRRRSRRQQAPIPSTKPMEQMLWDAACSIRGAQDAAKFKDYLLPLLFLKRLSDVFDDEMERLAEEFGDPQIAREIAESDHDLLRFYLPPEARWSAVSGREVYEWPLDQQGRNTRPKDTGEHLTRAVRAVVRHNPTLSGVIDLVDFAAERNGERDINPARLAAVVETFSDPRYRLGLADVQPDFLGRAYEYLLRKFAEGSGQSAGEFFTPTEVGYLMAHLMRPRPGETCHDYACGSAGLLVKLQLVARELDPTGRVPLKLCGQELQAEGYAVAHMNAIIHDMDVEIARGDTMINPRFKNAAGQINSYDVVVANPMWNQPFDQQLFANDPFDRFRPSGGVTTGRGDWAWLQHTLACLNERGRAAVVLDTGAVTRGSGSRNEDRERNIRKWFVDRDLIDGVILLPDNLFYNTSAAGIILVLSKRKPEARKGKIVLLNASRRVGKGQPKNYIPEGDIRPLAAAFLKGEPVEGEVAVITREQAEQADYNLSPSRWVGQTEAFTSSRPINQIVAAIRLLEREESEIDDSLESCLVDLDTATPHDWREVPLADVTLPTKNWNPKNEPRVEVQYVDVSAVSRDELRIVGTANYSSDTAPSRARKIVRSGDTIYATVRPALRRIAQVPESLDGEVVSTAFCVLRADPEVLEPDFLNFAVQVDSFAENVAALETGASYPAVRDSDVLQQEIPLPPISEQRKIVAILDSIHRKIDLHRRKRAVMQELFKALLHKLMTGEIWVGELDLKAMGEGLNNVGDDK